MNRRLSLILSVAALAASPSCILLSGSGDDVQCASDAECAEIGEGLVCDPNAQVCVEFDAQAGSTGSVSTSTSATTGGSGGGDTVECTTNSECIDANGQLPYICREGRCLGLLTEQCSEFIGDLDGLRDDAPIIIGYIGQYSGADEVILTSEANARNGLRLAIEEIDKVSGGLPVGPNNSRRRMYSVGCDDVGGLDGGDALEASIAHLTDTLDVPIIVGITDEQSAFKAAQDIFVPQGRLYVQELGETEDWRTLEDNGLVWVASLLGNSMARTMSLVYKSIEPELSVYLEGADVRLAVIAHNDTAGLQLADEFNRDLTINGLSPGEAFDAGTFTRLSLELDLTNLSDVTLALQSFAPTIVVTFGNSVDNPEILTTAEVSWPEGTPRPFWMFDLNGFDYGTENAIKQLMLDGELTIGDRVFGVRPYLPPSRDNYDAFGIRYRARFDNASPGTLSGPLPYDTYYFLAYAILGAGNVTELTGSAVAAGFAKQLPPGATIDIGPSKISEGISALKANTNIDFEGTLSGYQWDLGTGVSRQYESTWCYARTGETGLTTAITGIVWDPTTDTVSGDMGACRKW